ncbi:MAG: hypothetical protein KDJ80_02020 [Nitratireductor sp.]|nr:hypothetical protein [Nitratireductor sp.]
MSADTSPSPAEAWLAIRATDSPDLWRVAFQEHHLGNPLIRSVHGGVVGALMEHAAIRSLEYALAEKGLGARVGVVTTAIDYMRVTKDADLFARARIERIARRVAFLSVHCWQDGEDMPVARCNSTLRIVEDSAA